MDAPAHNWAMRLRKRYPRLFSYAGLCVAVGVSGFGVIHLPLIAGTYHGTRLDAQTAGEFGDFIGGYFGPIFSLVGIVLLIFTLKTEQESARHQAFENKYFELLKIHRDNVTEIELLGSSGRKVFVLMLREWRCVLHVVRQVTEETGRALVQRDLLEITYYCFFFGTGPNSSRMLKSSLGRFDPVFIKKIEATLNDEELKLKLQADRKFGYKPLEGHQSRLGHYYRHLYQMVRYVHENKPSGARYDYMKTIRAQLSTHEQALLLLNSLSRMGADWWNKHLIDDYRMVQNIPKDFFIPHLELPLDLLFGARYFEWQTDTAPPVFDCLVCHFVLHASMRLLSSNGPLPHFLKRSEVIGGQLGLPQHQLRSVL